MINRPGYPSPERPGRIHKVPIGPAEASHSASLPEVITLQPGQRALLVYKRALTRDEAHAIKQRLTERYPDNEISIADSVDSVVVLPPRPAPDTSWVTTESAERTGSRWSWVAIIFGIPGVLLAVAAVVYELIKP